MRAFVAASLFGSALAALAVFACGGVDPLPPPPPPPPAMPTPSIGQAALAEAGVEAPPEAPVLLVAGAPSPEPAPPPASVRITSPAKNQVVERAHASDFPIKLDVKNWPVSPAGAHVHVLLDGRPARTIDDLKAPLHLGDLGAAAIGDGHHVLIAALARGSNETLKTKDALAVSEFFVDHKTAASVDLKKPYIVLSKPDGAYEGQAADHVLVDFLAVGVTLADEKEKIALRLEGPGIEGAALAATTTRIVPYYLENLRAGAYTLTVEILGADGKPLDNPWAKSTRTITVTRAARTQEPRKATPPILDAGAAAHGDGAAQVETAASLVDASSSGASTAPDASLPHLRPPPVKPKPTMDKPKPPTPPVKRR